jgi:hypothetical protein
VKIFLGSRADDGVTDLEFGIDADKAQRNDPDFDPAASKNERRRWLQSSLDVLADAAAVPGARFSWRFGPSDKVSGVRGT